MHKSHSRLAQPRLAVVSALVAALVMGAGAAQAKPKADAADTGPAVAVFTDSSAAALGGNKRMAISEVVISFQTSTGQTIATGSLASDIAKRGLGGLLRHDKTTETGFMRLELDPAVAREIANNVYRDLQSQLKAAGFEVVPESQVVAATAYQAILKEAGYTNGSKYWNSQGDVLLMGPDALKPYMPYGIEAGDFFNNGHNLTYIKGWIKQVPFSGGSSTEGGPKFTLDAGVWKLPDLEKDLAKELNANVVKATYVVTLGKLDLAVAHDYSVQGDNYQGTNATTTTTSTSGTATAGLGLQERASRIAIRTAAGKSQKAVKGENFQSAKDGDVVVTLNKPVQTVSNFFTLKNAGELEAVVNVTDAAAFSTAATRMLGAEQGKMLGLLKQ